ncbi:MAG: SEC-C domain-containing protein [Planctomycetota bacterium]
MAVDPYAPCPCGSVKKLKFCCPDLTADFEKINRYLEGEQPRAAITHLANLLQKHPEKTSLLELKASIELSQGDLEAAAETTAKHLEADPSNPAASAQAASLAAARATAHASADTRAGRSPDVVEAVHRLQDALERIDESIPSRVLQAVGSVGQALLVAGDLVAARAHLWLYQGIAGKADTRATELLVRLNQAAGLPVLLRDSLFLREAPAGHPADAANDHAQLLAGRGQWRRAAEALDHLCAEHADLAEAQYNAAVVHGWLGDAAAFVAGMRRFAELTAAGNGLTDDAVEAEAIAQLLDPAAKEDRIDVVRTTFAVADEEALVDALTRSDRTSVYQLAPEELEAIDGPPPRQTVMLLDRSLPATGEGITAEATPRITGLLSYYGRTTGRAERLELTADRDASHNATLQAVHDTLGAAIGDVSDTEVVGQAASADASMKLRWRFPDDTPVAVRRELLKAERSRMLAEDWADTPHPGLGGRTPAEAANGDATRLAAAAAVLVIEQAVGGTVDGDAVAKLRARLGIDAPPAIDPRTADLETLPISRLSRVNLADASDDDLVMLYERVELAGEPESVLRVTREAVSRASLVDRLPLEGMYQRLATLEPDPADALAWVEKARAEADSAGRSNAIWDLIELELRVLEGQIEAANRVIDHLRTTHLNEPGVAERLYGLLYSLGAAPDAPMTTGGPAIDPAGAPPAAALEPTAAPAGDASSKLWTPGDDAPSGGGGGQKIWTPS